MSDLYKISAQLDELKQRRAAIGDELKGINDKMQTEGASAGLKQRGANLATALANIDAQSEELTTAYKSAVREGIDSGMFGGESGDGARPYEMGPLGGLKSDAERVLEGAFKSAGLSDGAAERAESLLKQGSEAERGTAARWVKAAGDPAYLSAFAKLLKDPSRGHMLWSGQEKAAYAEAKAVQTALKAGSITGNSELLPLNLDPTILLTSDGSTDPIRRIARVVQTVSNTWQGVTSAGVTAEWKSEGAQMTDAAPATDPAPIPVHFGDAWVPYSFELEMDAGPAWARDLGRLLADAADQLQAAAYLNGTGAGQPKGIRVALPAGSKLASTTADVLVAADVVNVQNALPPRFQARAQWIANLATINAMAGFETTAGALRFPELADSRLLRKPVHEASYMETAGGTAAADNDDVLIYGDWSNFVIADRIGTTVEVVPHVVGVDGRPTGQRGVIMWFRTGSDVVVPNAFRMLTA